MKLKTKITLSTLAAILTLFLIAMSYNTYYFYKEAKEFRNKEIDTNISFFVSEIDKLTNTADKLGTDISNIGERYFEIKKKSTFIFKDEISEFLIEKVNNYPEIIGAGLWYESGVVGEKFFGPYATWKQNKVQITWEYSNEAYNYFNQAWYKQAIPIDSDKSKAKSTYKIRTSPFVDELNGIKTIFLTFTTLMYSKEDKIIGTSTVDLGLSNIKKLLSEFKMTPSSYIILIDKNSGKIVYHPNEEKLLTDFKEIQFLKNLDLANKNNKTENFEIQINSEKYILYSSHSQSSFILLTLLNQKEAYSVVYNIIIRNIILSFFTIVLIGIVVYALVNRSTKPLDEIISVLRGISDGSKSMSDRINIQTKDEFGELATNYNQMALTIQKQNIEIKEHSDRLEEKVINRTQQLNKTLEEITSLKNQQDGDYYLTSLLLEPLSKNDVKVGNIDLNFSMKQKKKFTFKKFSKEIGGDICTAHSIQLQDKTYTVFLNADAMGKSIQGAGGALILGSVFNAIVQRTLVSENSNSLSPERWMKNSFLELHKTFETFDGSMLVSLVLCLLDNETGFLYFINAEHPLTVLYRDGKASFLESKIYYHKLGIQTTSHGIFIDSIQLQKGDIILLGSDGRDDILIGDSKIMNEDENKFLGIIEISNGDINEILYNLEKSGELTDDLSILRLEYKYNIIDEKVLSQTAKELILKSRESERKNEYEKSILILEEADKLHKNHPEIIREKIKIYLNSKSHLKIIELAEMYLKMKPDDEDIIHILSQSHKKLKQFVKAFTISEKLWLRKSENIDYITNYIEVCEHLKFKEKIFQAIEYLNHVDSSNSKIQDLGLKYLA